MRVNESEMRVGERRTFSLAGLESFPLMKAVGCRLRAAMSEKGEEEEEEIEKEDVKKQHINA
jgi:hypothetical protein